MRVGDHRAASGVRRLFRTPSATPKATEEKYWAERQHASIVYDTSTRAR